MNEECSSSIAMIEIGEESVSKIIDFDGLTYRKRMNRRKKIWSFSNSHSHAQLNATGGAEHSPFRLPHMCYIHSV